MGAPITLPAGATIGKSFEYGLDVNLGTYAAPNWQPVRRISGFQPTPTPSTQDAQTYDDYGAANQDVTGWSWALAFNAQVNRLQATGLYLPEIEALLARTRPSAKGELAVIDVRWYHKPETGKANPTDAGRGFATVAYQRQNTGPEGAIEQFAFTLTGKGPAEEIANPFSAATTTAPSVTAASPAGALTGDLVTLTGANLLGATTVKFGTKDATKFTVIGGSTIIAVLPTDPAGTVNVVVTTPAGASPAFAYTRGA